MLYNNSTLQILSTIGKSKWIVCGDLIFDIYLKYNFKKNPI